MSDAPYGNCAHPKKENILAESGRSVAIRCAVCTEVLSFVGSCICHRNGFRRLDGMCSEDCAKEAAALKSARRRAHRAENRRSQGKLPGVE